MKNSIDKTIANLQKQINILLQSRRNVVGADDKHPSNRLSISTIGKKNEEIRELYLEKNHIRNKYFDTWKKIRNEIKNIEIPSTLNEEDQRILRYKKADLIKKTNRAIDRRNKKSDQEKEEVIEETRLAAKEESNAKDTQLSKKVQKIYSGKLLQRLSLATMIGLAAGAGYFALDYFKYEWSHDLPGTTETTTNTQLIESTASTTTITSPTADTTVTSGTDITTPVDIPLPGDPDVTVVTDTTATDTSTQTYEYIEETTSTTKDVTVSILDTNFSISTFYLVGLVTAAVIVFGALSYLYKANKDKKKAKEIVKEGAVLDIIQGKVHNLSLVEERDLKTKLNVLKEVREEMSELTQDLNNRIIDSMRSKTHIEDFPELNSYNSASSSDRPNEEIAFPSTQTQEPPAKVTGFMEDNKPHKSNGINRPTKNTIAREPKLGKEFALSTREQDKAAPKMKLNNNAKPKNDISTDQFLDSLLATSAKSDKGDLNKTFASQLSSSKNNDSFVEAINRSKQQAPSPGNGLK